jgi:DNA repair protein RecO (recombination protein O)
MLITTKAIVISAIKYGEADLIIKLFTESSGLKSYLLRGVLKSKRGKFRASQFQPLTLLEVVAKHKDKGTLESLKEAKILATYQSLHTDILKSTVIMFLAEFLRNAVQEEEKNPKLFQFLENAFLWFDSNSSSNFHLLFLIKLSLFLGFYPEATNRRATFFNLLDGTFQDVSTNSYCISGENKDTLEVLLGINFDGLEELKLNQSNRSGMLSMLLLYYELHLQGFKKPKSLTVLKEIYS